MSKKPPINELDFIKASGNHRELLRKLTEMGLAGSDLTPYAQFVCEAWFRLGELHLREAQTMLRFGCPRSVFSRAYYAAYNASKGARYLMNGYVSLKGDDHAKVSTDLPEDFPNIAKWAMNITTLYEHRLHADYDNWSDTHEKFTLQPATAVVMAEEFINETRTYLNTKAKTAL